MNASQVHLLTIVKQDDLPKTADGQLNEPLGPPTMEPDDEGARPSKRLRWDNETPTTSSHVAKLPLEECLSDHIGQRSRFLYTMTQGIGNERVVFQGKWCMFNLLARACGPEMRLWNHETGSMVESDAQNDRLGVMFSKDPSAPAPKRFYVGFSARHMEPAFMCETSVDGSTAPVYKVVTEPSEAPVGADLIWHHNMTVPGNIKALKSLISGFQECEAYFSKPRYHLLKAVSQENQKFFTREPMEPLTCNAPTNNPPNLGTLYLDEDGVDRHWSLKWPPLAHLTIPLQFIDEVKEFLRQYPMDISMDLSTAVAATIIYFDMTDDPSSELWARESTTAGPIPSVSLAVFILYFPHMLRKVKELGLSRHIHPMRFAEVHYRRDCGSSGSFLIDGDDINTRLLRDLYACISCKNEDQSPLWRISMLPHTFPGANLEWPAFLLNYCTAQQHDLHAIGKIPDIRTIGLPIYHPMRCSTQYVLLPEEWYMDRCMNGATPQQGPVYAFESAVDPYHPSNIAAVTGNANFAGPVWSQVQGAAIMGPVAIPHAKDDGLLDRLGNFPTNKWFPKRTIARLIDHLETRLRLAQSLEIPIHAITVNQQVNIEWDGIDDALVQIESSLHHRSASADNGTLMKGPFEAPEYTLEPAKEPRSIADFIHTDFIATACSKIEDELRSLPFHTAPIWQQFLKMIRDGATAESLLVHLNQISAMTETCNCKTSQLVAMIRDNPTSHSALQICIAQLPKILMAPVGLDIPTLDLENLGLSFLDYNKPIEDLNEELDRQINRIIVQVRRRKDPVIVADMISLFARNALLEPQRQMIGFCREILEQTRMS